MERTSEQSALHWQLLTGIIAKRKVILSQQELAKLEICCWRAIDDNPDLSESSLLIAVGVYLNFILEFPDLVL